MASEVIKQFLVLLEFKADANQAKEMLLKVDNIGKGLMGLAFAMEAAAVALKTAVLLAAEGLDKLYWAAQLAGTTPEVLDEFGYAAKQMGKDANTATEALKGLNALMHSYKGQQIFASMGISVKDKAGNYRDPREAMREAVDYILSKTRREEHQWRFDQLGLGDLGLQEMLRHPGDIAKWEKQRREDREKSGVNLKQAAHDAHDLVDEWNRLKETINDIKLAVTNNLSPKVKEAISDIRKTLEEHAPQIVKSLTWFGEGLLGGDADLGKITGKWVTEYKKIMNWEQLEKDRAAFHEKLKVIFSYVIETWVPRIKAAVDGLNNFLGAINRSPLGAGGPGGGAGGDDQSGLLGGGGPGGAPSAGSTQPGTPAEKKGWWGKTKDWYNRNAPAWAGGQRADTGSPGEAPAGARANFMSGRPVAPGDRSRLTTVTAPSGQRLAINSESAEAFQGFLNDLGSAGAPLGNIGSHSVRRIAGVGRWSQHAYANAMDLGSQTARDIVNPAFRGWVQSHPNQWRAAINKWGMISGGDWRKPDLGHVEWGGVKPWQKASPAERGAMEHKLETRRKEAAETKQWNPYNLTPQAKPSPFGSLDAESIRKRFKPTGTFSGAQSGPTNNFSYGQSVTVNVGAGDGVATKTEEMAGSRDQARLHKNLEGSAH